jgi:O-acetyl-ADP-ribose deacetylase (regulator of RNase III)
MLKEVEGDLIQMGLNGEFDLILHGCNCFCTMGGGIARSIRAKFPEAYAVDCNTVRGDKSKLGLFTYIQTPVELKLPNDVDGELEYITHTLTVVNAYTQYNLSAGEDVFEYEAFDHALRLIKRKFPNKRIGLPLIGCGLAGGDEARIREIIERNAADADITLVIFKP